MVEPLANKMASILGPTSPISQQLPGYRPRPAQVEMARTVARALEDDMHAVIEAGTGVGKALSEDTPIPTPSGWTRMRDIRQGDTVFSETGRSTRVVEAFATLYGRPCYEILFCDGSTLVADGDHGWPSSMVDDRDDRPPAGQAMGGGVTVRRGILSLDASPLVGAASSRRGTGDGHARGIVTTREMARTLVVSERSAMTTSNHAIAVASALQLPAVALPMHPYLAGRRLGNVDRWRPRVAATGGETVGATGSRARGVSDVRGRGTPEAIPPLYTRAAEAQRRALLAGLLDTSGGGDGDGSVAFVAMDELLARDTLELARGLGYSPTFATLAATARRGVAYKVAFTTPDRVFGTDEKARMQRARLHGRDPARHAYRYVVAVRPIPSTPVRCIRVDSPSHLYLAGEAMVPTHNSMGYLTPAIYSGKRVIISTPSKALQDQLVGKDIPFLKRVLPVAFTAAVVKGRSNYLCMDRLQQEILRPGAGRDALERVARWAEITDTGDLDELPDPVPTELRRRVRAGPHTCIGDACAYWDECFIEGAHEEAEDADIVVTNHALLLADLKLRLIGDDEKVHILPDRDAIVLDEAHQLEEAARGAFSISLRRGDLDALRADALLRRHAGAAMMGRLRRAGDLLFDNLTTRPGALTGDIPSGLALADILDDLADDLNDGDPFHGEKATRASRLYRHLVARLARVAGDARRVSEDQPDYTCRYVEVSGAGEVSVVAAPLSVDGILARALFAKTPVICASATLAVPGFAQYRRAVGMDLPLTGEDGEKIPPRPCLEMVAESPFDYRDRALLYTPTHLPEFHGTLETGYVRAIADEMERLVRLTDGRAFLLFSSNAALDAVHRILAPRLPYLTLRQDQGTQADLVRRFREDGHAVLFASRTYWTGIDIAGDTLSLVVMDRVPFASPEEPILRARMARMEARNAVRKAKAPSARVASPFHTLYLPPALIILKQGFGRLLRTSDDRGVVAILDARLATKTYARAIWAALPPAPRTDDYLRVEAFVRDVTGPEASRA